MKNFKNIFKDIKSITKCKSIKEWEIIFPIKTSSELIQKVIDYCRCEELCDWHIKYPENIYDYDKDVKDVKDVDEKGKEIKMYWVKVKDENSND